VRYQEFTENTLLNQILKTMILSLRTATKRQANKKLLNVALIYLEDVQTVRLSEIIFRQVQFNRLNENYRTLLVSAKLFYLNRQPRTYARDERTFTFLVPLN
jgi:5-methylcytosine-specific restriction enzyme subunit McrC